MDFHIIGRAQIISQVFHGDNGIGGLEAFK